MTNGIKINKQPAKPRVLVAPLEWGLGHATRCIPIINELILLGVEVFIAAEGATESLLKNEFPGLKFLPLMGYRVKYSRKKIFLPWKLFTQLPKIFFTLGREHRWLKKIVANESINAVISDNRFGLYHKKIKSIYITHQLLIKTGNRFTEKIAQQFHYRFIRKYSECWVPDFKQAGLAGQLSHPLNLPGNVKYIGALSRFEKETGIQKKYDLLVTVSGPEPQRTVFEEKILSELENYEGQVLFARGLPASQDVLSFENKNIHIVNHLSGDALNMAMQQSGIVICRSGYTSVMDLIKLGKKAILIPTPGQTEQEYLAEYLKEKNYFYSVDQKDFSLKKDIVNADPLFKSPGVHMNAYKNVIKEFVLSLNLHSQK